MDATAWRRNLATKWELPQLASDTVPIKVTILDRPHGPYARYLENLAAMEKIVQKYGVAYEVIELNSSSGVKGTLVHFCQLKSHLKIQTKRRY